MVCCEIGAMKVPDFLPLEKRHYALELVVFGARLLRFFFPQVDPEIQQVAAGDRGQFLVADRFHEVAQRHVIGLEGFLLAAFLDVCQILVGGGLEQSPTFRYRKGVEGFLLFAAGFERARQVDRFQRLADVLAVLPKAEVEFAVGDSGAAARPWLMTWYRQMARSGTSH
jgi:hypothetical protein